jgi:hypothetical protein
MDSLPDDVTMLVVAMGGDPLAQRAVCRSWRTMTDSRCAGWSTALQRHACDFLSGGDLVHACDGCTPCLEDRGSFFMTAPSSTCLNLRHYAVDGRRAINYLLRHSLPTEYDIDVLRSQSAGAAVAQKELEAARRAVVASLNARVRALAEKRDERALQLRRAFSKRRAIFKLLGAAAAPP